MSDAELKLKIFRLIDNQNSETLYQLYDLILSRLHSSKNEYSTVEDIEAGYKKMALDRERETKAFEWIEGTLDTEEL